MGDCPPPLDGYRTGHLAFAGVQHDRQILRSGWRGSHDVGGPFPVERSGGRADCDEEPETHTANHHPHDSSPFTTASRPPLASPQSKSSARATWVVIVTPSFVACSRAAATALSAGSKPTESQPRWAR